MPLFKRKPAPPPSKILFVDCDQTITRDHTGGRGLIICKNKQFYLLQENGKPGKNITKRITNRTDMPYQDGLYPIVNNDAARTEAKKNKQNVPNTNITLSQNTPIAMRTPLMMTAVLSAAKKAGYEPVVVSFHGGMGKDHPDNQRKHDGVSFQHNDNGKPKRGGSPAILGMLNYWLPKSRSFFKDKDHIVAQIAPTKAQRDKYGKEPHMDRAAELLGADRNEINKNSILVDDDTNNLVKAREKSMHTVSFEEAANSTAQDDTQSYYAWFEVARKAGITPTVLEQEINATLANYQSHPAQAQISFGIDPHKIASYYLYHLAHVTGHKQGDAIQNETVLTKRAQQWEAIQAHQAQLQQTQSQQQQAPQYPQQQAQYQQQQYQQQAPVPQQPQATRVQHVQALPAIPFREQLQRLAQSNSGFFDAMKNNVLPATISDPIHQRNYKFFLFEMAGKPNLAPNATQSDVLQLARQNWLQHMHQPTPMTHGYNNHVHQQQQHHAHQATPSNQSHAQASTTPPPTTPRHK